MLEGKNFWFIDPGPKYRAQAMSKNSFLLEGYVTKVGSPSGLDSDMVWYLEEQWWAFAKQDSSNHCIVTACVRWHHPYGRKWRGTKKPLDESEKESEKVGLKLNIQKTKIMAFGPITSRQIDG